MSVRYELVYFATKLKQTYPEGGSGVDHVGTSLKFNGLVYEWRICSIFSM